MDYIKNNIDNFSIVKYFQYINITNREIAEQQFKKTINNIINFKKEKKTLRLINFALGVLDNQFEVLHSTEADNYWCQVLGDSTQRKRLYSHLITEDNLAEAILKNAKKKVNLQVIKDDIKTSGQSSVNSLTETNIWEVWKEVLKCIDSENVSLINEYSLEHLGIIQLGDNISNRTTRRLFAPNLVETSNKIIRKEQKNILLKFIDVYDEIFKLMESCIESCEDHLKRISLKVKANNDASLSFCYDIFLLFVQQVYSFGGLDRSETMYNYRLLWRLLDIVAKAEAKTIYDFLPGEVRLIAIKDELTRRGLSLINHYNADGVIIDNEYGFELMLLETSGAYGECTPLKKNTDHVKATYGLIALLHAVVHKYCFADFKIFKKLKVYFVHAAGQKMKLWTLNLAASKLYILNRQRSCKIPVKSENCREDFTNVVNMMWELKEGLAISSSIINDIKKSHDRNKKTDNMVDLKTFLGESVYVKLPPACSLDIDNIDLSSSPFRPSSSYINSTVTTSDEDKNDSDDSKDDDYQA